MALTLSQIRNFDTGYLTEPAKYLTAEADRAHQVFTESHAQVSGATWQGASGHGARAFYASNLAAVTADAAAHRAAASTMVRAAEQLANARDEVIGVAAQAEQDGFQVGEDFTVTDVKSKTVQEEIVRQPYAQEYAGQLAAKVAAFQAADTGAATAMGPHAAALGGFRFTDYTSPIAPTDQPDPAPVTGPPGVGRVDQTIPTGVGGCTQEQWIQRSAGTLAATAGTVAAILSIPEAGPIGVAGAMAGALGTGSAMDVLSQCAED